MKNWWNRHPNWGLFLFGYLGCFLACFIVDFCVMFIAYTVDVNASDDLVEGLALLFSYPVYIGILIWVTIYYLKAKARRYWNLFWYLCPFGMIIMLYLQNKSREDEESLYGPYIPPKKAGDAREGTAYCRG